MANTRPKSLRIPDAVWAAAVAKAGQDGTTVTAVVVDALTIWLESDPA